MENKNWEDIKEKIEEVTNTKYHIHKKDGDVSFIGNNCILTFLKKENIAIFSPHIELYPDQSCTLMTEMMKIIKSVGTERITVGSAFLFDGTQALFGDEAVKHNEKKLENFLEEEIEMRNSLNYVMENFEGLEC